MFHISSPIYNILTYWLYCIIGINSAIVPNPISVYYCCQSSRFPLLHFPQSFESILLNPKCCFSY